MIAQQLVLREPSSTHDYEFLLQDPYFHEQEEEEDILSLCDLPLASSGDEYKYFSSTDEQSSPSFGDHGFFEFFSEDFTASTYPSADKIVFCGKIIGSKEEEGEEAATMVRDSRSQEFKGNLFNQLSASPSPRCQGSLNKVSRVSSTSSLVKSKWYVLEFGMGRYSMKMERRDNKKRQSHRRAPSTMFRTVEKRGTMESNRRRSGKVLWALLRLLGCKKNQKTRS